MSSGNVDVGNICPDPYGGAFFERWRLRGGGGRNLGSGLLFREAGRCSSSAYVGFDVLR